MLCSRPLGILIVLGLFTYIQSYGQSYGESWESKKESGWLWYQEGINDLNRESDKLQDHSVLKPTNQKLSEHSFINNTKSYRSQVKKVRETFEEALAQSILHPTLANVRRTKLLQENMFARSEVFSKLWLLASVLDSSNYRASANPNNFHQQLYRQKKETLLIQKIKTLAQTYGLFFAFKKQCPYCHKFAPLLSRFASEFGFKVKAISKNGGKIPGLKNVSKDNGTLSVINPQGVYPALFLANPHTLEVIPVAWGMVSRSQLLQNFETIIKAMEMPHAP